MFKKPNCPVIAVEEHYWDKELAADTQGIERNPNVTSRLFDTGEVRLKEMDEAGIDIQVLSHGAPSAQKLMGPEELCAVGVALQRSLAEASDACLLPNAATRLRPKQ